MNTKGMKFLAVLAVLAMAFAAFAVVTDADQDDAEVGVTYTEISAADFKAKASSGVITLDKNYCLTDALIILKTESITKIDLKGFSLVNKDVDTDFDTIYVSIGATLEITDSSSAKTGNVDNVTHQKAALFNNGTVTLSGGTFTRSSEDSSSNTYYNIVNHGTMTVESGVTVSQSGNFSSLFENGYYDITDKTNERKGYVKDTNVKNPTLTINGGTFAGGLNTLKNDDGAVLTINGGTFTAYSQACFLNWNVAAVNGGEFSGGQYSIINGCNPSAKLSTEYVNQGKLTISGSPSFTGYSKALITNYAGKQIGFITNNTSAEIEFIEDGNVTVNAAYDGTNNQGFAGTGKIKITIPSTVTLTVSSLLSVGPNAYFNNQGTFTNNGTIAGSDGASGKWTYTDKVLTLNNYNGMPTYMGMISGIEEVILAGDSVLSIAKEYVDTGAVIVGGDALKKISNDSGVATLKILVDTDADDAVWGIHSGTDLKITGVDVDVTITGKSTAVAGIHVDGKLTLFNSNTSVSVCPTQYNQSYVMGIYAAALEAQSSDITSDAGYIGIWAAGDVDVENSDITASGSKYGLFAGNTSVSQSSDITLNASGLAPIGLSPSVGSLWFTESYGLFICGTLTNKSYSQIDSDGIYLGGNGSNYAGISISEKMVIAGGATLTNYTDGVIENSGKMGIYGSLVLNDGEFKNNGELIVFQTPTLKQTAAVEPVRSSGTAVTSLTIGVNVLQTAEGVAFVGALINLNDGQNTTSNLPYYGTMTYNSDGVLTSGTLTAITYNNATMYTSVITISSTTTTVGDVVYYSYTFVTSGSYYDSALITTAGISKLESVTTGTVVNKKIELVTLAPTGGSITVSGGTFTNASSMVMNPTGSTFIVSAGTFDNQGTLVTYSPITVSGGEIQNAGMFIADGAISISKGSIVSTGTMAIDASVSLTSADATFDGDFSISDGNVITVTGKIDSVITYAGEYPTSATDPTKKRFSNTIAVAGKGTGFVITATSNASSYKAGVFTLTGLQNIKDKTATSFNLTEGKAIIGSNVALDNDGTITAASGTTLEVSSGTSDIRGVIAIQDGATFNRWITGESSTYAYGQITCVISFANDGCTYFCNLAFALENAPEGAEMTLESSTTISSSTKMKDGVVLTFAEGANLTIAGTSTTSITFVMGEGAKFVIPSASTISFNYAKVSGTIEYGENVMELDAVVFDSGTASTITATAATTTVPEDIFTIAFEEIDNGSIAFNAGYSDGTITLDAVTDSTGAVTSFGSIYFADGTQSIIVISPGTDKPAKASIVIDGELGIMADNTTMLQIPVTGNGAIILDDGKSITSYQGVKQSIAIGNGEDGFILDEVLDGSVYANSAWTVANYTITAVKETSTTAPYVTISGSVSAGDITTAGNVHAKQTLLTKADAVMTVAADSTLTVESTVITGKEYAFDAVGLLKVIGTINMYTSETTSYGVVNYDITYADGSATVYTVMATAIEEAPEGTELVVGKNLVLTDDVKIAPGVNIVITDGYYMQLANGKRLIIGEGKTSVGADAIVSGNIVLNGAASYIVDYAGSGSDITVWTTTDMDVAATASLIIALETEYATIYTTDNTAEFTTAMAKAVQPEITGYYFSQWETLGGTVITPGVATSTMSEAPFVAALSASKVNVTFAKVTGINYYVNGDIVNTLDAPVKVAYGATITAQISDSSKYTGSPLVNGEKYITVDNSVSTVTGSGVTPIPEPTPEPEVGDSGISLTDILLIVLVILIAVMVVILILRLNRS